MFNGFTQQTIDFLWEICTNNNKEWFEQHKDEYKSVLVEPMKQLTDEIYADYLTYGSPLMIKSVSRIQKDARFPHAYPYRDNCWFTLKEKREDWWAMPAYYFEISPKGWSYGMGMWSTTTQNMQKFRNSIDENPKKLEKIARQIEKDGIFTLEGDSYKRSKGEPSPLLTPWYNKKCFSLCRNRTYEDKAVFSRELLDEMCENFRKLEPAREYIANAFMRAE